MSESTKASDSAVTPGVIRLRWTLGLLTVFIFYGCFFLGVYLTLKANQIAVMTFAITSIPGFLLWLSFRIKPKAAGQGSSGPEAPKP